MDFGTDVAIPALKITRLGDPERLIYEGTPPSDRVAELRRRTGLIKPGLGLVDTGSALVNTTIFHEFRMDLRQLVKEFPIGVYRAQFSFPDIRLTRKDGPVTDEAFVSPEFEFEVGTCGPTLEDLPRRYDWFSPIPDLVRATPNSSDRTFTITNRAEYPVHLKYRPEVNTADGTYAGMIFLQKWTCEGEWEGAGLLGFARSNKPLPFITLQPGESAKLVAPDWLVDGYGYYRYGMEVYRGDVSNPTRESSLLHLSLLSPHFQVRFPNEKSSELAGEADQ